MDNSTTRRAFLAQAAASLGVAYLGSLTPGLIAQAHQHAKAMASNAETRDFRFFTPQQAADYEAFASQIIPSDETPGAKEANVVHFSDFALSEIEPQNKKAFIAALDALSVQTKKTVPNARTFAGLTASQQSEVMTAIEKTPEFGILRTYSVIGFLVDPIDGGNKNGIGWKLIGFEDKFYYQAPFGYYDAHSDEVKS